jgi:ribose-phosphate pyrophosphokinase
MNALCLSFPWDAAFGRSLANVLGAAHGDLGVHRFPDGETLVRLDENCAQRSVILVCGGQNPNAAALPLYFAAHTARAMGARSVGLVAPYLPYMRQDMAFHQGEAVSASAYGKFLSGIFDWVATVDPHLHRVKSLDEVFSIPAACVSSMPAVSEWIAGNLASPVIIGPDAESTQWASSVAGRLGVPWTVLQKTRAGDREVSLSLPDPAILRGRTPVIVDDIASSGHTLIEVAKRLQSLSTGPVTCVVVHALLEPGAEMAIRAAGVASFVSTNTVTHASNAIDVVPLLAERIRASARGSAG